MYTEFFAFSHLFCEIIYEILQNAKNDKSIAGLTLKYIIGEVRTRRNTFILRWISHYSDFIRISTW